MLVSFHVVLLAVRREIGIDNSASSGQHEEAEGQEYDGYGEPILST